SGRALVIAGVSSKDACLRDKPCRDKVGCRFSGKSADRPCPSRQSHKRCLPSESAARGRKCPEESLRRPWSCPSPAGTRQYLTCRHKVPAHIGRAQAYGVRSKQQHLAEDGL